MAPAFRAIAIVLAFLALAPHLAARWRFDVRQELVPPAPTNPVFVGELTPPQPLEIVRPDPPGDAIAKGAVTLSFCVTRDGKVIHVAVTRSLSPEFDELSAQAVRAWRFTPAMRAGRPEKARVEVTFTFAGDTVSVSARHAGSELAVPASAQTTRPARRTADSLYSEPTMLSPPW
jgi:TonB family protein